jgi:AcrR family transcriptional regulator
MSARTRRGVAASSETQRRPARGAVAGMAVEPLPAGRGIPGVQVAEIQRSRLLAATVAALGQVGYECTTVAEITKRARVSRRTFYDLFVNREDCIAAVLQNAAGHVQSELEAENLGGLEWRERMRRGLWTVLSFLDREPAWARVLVLDAQRGNGSVLAARQAIVDRLVVLVNEGRGEKSGARCSELTAEGVLGATLAIVHQRLAREQQTGKGGTRAQRREPLTQLFSELLGIVLLPYLGSTATRREQARPVPTPTVVASPPLRPLLLADEDPLAGLQMRLTYRTARVLEGVSQHAGVSNRQVADYAGITDQGQVSKLLARLKRLGLLTNHGDGHLKGEPNAWQLTSRGQLVTERIRVHAQHKRRVA